MEIRKEEFDAHFAFIEKLESAFLRYAAEVGIEKAHLYSFYKVHTSYVEFQWYETWSYGGEENHCQQVPTSFLFDYATWKEKYEAARAEEARIIAERQEEQRATREKEERAQLKKLKERYE